MFLCNDVRIARLFYHDVGEDKHLDIFQIANVEDKIDLVAARQSNCK